MQKKMIKSILAVAVVGTFSATAFAAMPSVDDGSGAADVTKINSNFTTLDNSKLDKSTYANNALLVNSKLAEKVDTATFNTKLNATASTLQGNIDTNKANIAANKEQIDLLTRVDNAQNQQIADIQHKNNTQDNLIKGNTEAIKANANDIATNKTNIQTNANNIATNKTNIQTNANNIATNKANIQTNTNNIAANKEQIDLLTRVDNAQNQQIADIQHKNNTQDNLIKGNTEAIKANANDIATNKTNIQTNANNIATNKTNIQTNANNIATNKANIQTNANNIAANRTLIEQYKASSDAQFKAVNSRIDSLDDKMKKGFASQAALNGLFQPYNVGKFNVSAAIGGYDSEQAMALGTGYRFNDNFAIKAGVASDLSGFDHVTYNIGANFEF